MDRNVAGLSLGREPQAMTFTWDVARDSRNRNRKGPARANQRKTGEEGGGRREEGILRR